MKIKNVERVQVLVSHSTPLVDSQESHQEKNHKDIFMDGLPKEARSYELMHLMSHQICYEISVLM
ncbi:hypothetical protein E2C01_036082 [Portunus trituberculatus]|uniref:Uncharacterized protein n=1 Tax=Portunus trituberculatus TaxID=210409 RepID=A0A5B7F4U8_PORTR|nr:hypothetical protein [Portunus trituberculatus]